MKAIKYKKALTSYLQSIIMYKQVYFCVFPFKGTSFTLNYDTPGNVC